MKKKVYKGTYKISQVAVDPFTGKEVPLEPLLSADAEDAIEAIKAALKKGKKLKGAGTIGEEESYSQYKQDGLTTTQACHAVVLDKVRDAVEESKRQRKNQKPERHDALSIFLTSIIQAHPEWPDEKILEELKKHEDEDVIQEVTDEKVFWVDKYQKVRPCAIYGKNGTVGAFERRILRIRKKLNLPKRESYTKIF